MVRVNNSDQNNINWLTSLASQAARRIQREFKSLVIEFKGLFSDIRGDVNRSAKYEFTGKHLNLKELSVEHKETYKEDLLVTTHNIAQRTLLSETETYEKEVEALKRSVVEHSPQFNELLDRPLVKNGITPLASLALKTKGGICSGMCVDLTRQLLTTDFNSPTFEADLKQLVSQFQYGGGTAAVANQVVYSMLLNQSDKQYSGDVIVSVLNELEKNEIITPIQKDMIFFILATFIAKESLVASSPLMRQKLEAFNPPSKFITRLEEALGTQESNLYLFFLSQLNTRLNKDKEPFSPQLLLEASTKALQSSKMSFSPHQFAVVNWLGGMTNYIQQVTPQGLKVGHVDQVTQPSNFSLIGRIINTVKNLFEKMVKPKEKEALKLHAHQFKRLVELQDLRLSDEARSKEIERARGLEFRSMERTLGLVGSQSDEEYLQHVDDLLPGTYELVVHTDEGGHSTLFVKGGDGQGYLFDPNVGLFKCDTKDPAQTILKVINRYKPPTEAAEHGLSPRHNLQFRQAAPLSS